MHEQVMHSDVNTEFRGRCHGVHLQKAKSVMRVGWSLRKRVVTGRAGCLTLDADSCWDTGESAVRTQDTSETRIEKEGVFLVASPPPNLLGIDLDNPERVRKQPDG